MQNPGGGVRDAAGAPGPKDRKSEEPGQSQIGHAISESAKTGITRHRESNGPSGNGESQIPQLLKGEKLVHR